MNLTIHRGTNEIGGSCVELRSQGKSLLLDIGTPLVNADRTRFDAAKLDRPVAQLLADKLLPDIPGLYGDGPCDVVGIVLSHAHLDHYGLGHYVRPDVPVYASKGTEAIINVSKVFLPNPTDIANLVLLPDRWQPMQIGPFTVTTYPVDHSAPDAVAVEVEADGHKVFYSGDLRAHGRKAKLFEHLVQRPPRDVDALLMEGSSIGRGPTEYPYPDEAAVEQAIVEEIADSGNLALLFCSSQNLDRIVTAFKAAKRTGRFLVIDLYTAYVHHMLQSLSSNIPQYSWEGVRVKYWKHHQEALARAGLEGFDMAVRRSGHGIKIDEVMDRRGEILMLAKANSLFPRLVNPCRLPSRDGLKLIWSMWRGYLEGEQYVKPFCDEHGLELKHIHTSGHASVDDLKRLAQAIHPKRLVPIHTFHPDEYEQFGAPVHRLLDGEPLLV